MKRNQFSEFVTFCRRLVFQSSLVGLFTLVNIQEILAEQVIIIEPKAETVLGKMIDYLNDQESLSFTAEITQDSILDSGQKIQIGAYSIFRVRRPNKIWIDYQGDRRHARFYFDGNIFTLEDVDKKVYARIVVDTDLNGLFNFADTQLNLTIPLEELIANDNDLEDIKSRINQGTYLGISFVNRFPCYHLAFTQDNLDWQIWIQIGDQPIPKKFLITYKNLPGSPQYSAIMSDWNFEPIPIAAPIFSFEPMQNYQEIEFLLPTTIEQP
ncbi:DUF2092 domain-containing protein [Gloeocapsa sp. PCC 73106]|uniref:DUF2092 domain-containing protein n=1 Tax=Gloeocapsa sp. PCC 73106 TaxID=102232 RepID=UPI0002ACB5A0|nr:DUF2092 domain-containing protein [Gloeocapsa sp. PCC 73106]ELR96678.1 putative periplasmic protein [Gloeocapsa sp. PCC 73106]